jgi:hypothetical protein
MVFIVLLLVAALVIGIGASRDQWSTIHHFSSSI